MSLYRGAGGASDATDDSTVNAVAGYASSAASSATNAASSATSASTSASSASTSATNAASSASLAATRASNAQTSATQAAGYATDASNEADDAAASALIAYNAANDASTYSSNALNYKNSASSFADAAAASAASAALSSSSASGSATTATSASSSASVSASNAADSASAAQISEDNAADSAADAQSAAASAVAARDATLAAYDSFDDRYLGAKPLDPSSDNDGNALLAGSLYFNSVEGIMKLYTGSAWVDAYTSGGSPSFGDLTVTGSTTLSGLTANRIPYLNGSKVLTTDASSLSYSGGNLAITGTLSAGGLSLTNGTALGVPYLNGSKIIVTGSALTFDGTTLATTGKFSGALNGTVGATTPSTGAFTTLAASGAVTLSGGTANGVPYLNGSKVLTSGSALTFDGTNLGIGTSSPLKQVHAYSSSTQAAVRVQGSGATSRADLYHQSSEFGLWGTEAIPFLLATNNTERLRINSSGNVGIGTSSPAATLHVVGNRIQTGYDSSNADIFWVQPTATDTRLRNRTALPLTFYTSDVERMRINSSGNVGIGTSSPGEKLVVSNATGSVAAQILASATGTSNLYFADGTTGADNYTGFIQYNHSTNAMNFGTNGGTTRATIDSSGNLIQSAPTTPPTLSTNGTMVFNLTSDTNLRISVRGSDGVTRTANITLA